MAFLIPIFSFLGKAWAVVWGFLKLAVTIPLGIVLGAVLAGFILGAGNGNARYKAGYDKGVAAERKAVERAAKPIVRAQAQITAKAETRAVKAQAKIEYRYRTLREKVRVYVPTETPPGVIRAGDRLPLGAVLLLDAAARGDDPDALSVTTGRTYETATAIRFDQLVDNYVLNLGVGHETSERLNGLQGWVRDQEAANPPVK